MQKIALLSALAAFFLSLLFVACPVEPPVNGGAVNDKVVTNVTVSRLEYNDRIRITWAPVPEADSYIIYRYETKSDPQTFFLLNSTGNVFDDTGAASNRPYFYKVASVINGAQSDKSANYIEGIYCSSGTDAWETNDSKATAIEAGEIAMSALVYSFNHGEAQDEDWYKYTGTESMLNIIVTLPLGSPISGLLTLEIDNGAEIILTEGENTLCYTGNDLFFRIYFTIADPDIDTINEYDLKLEFL